MAGKSTDDDPIQTRVPAAIEGIENQPLLVIKSLPWSFNLYLRVSSSEAFFKLRIPLSLCDKPKTYVYLFIWPEQISSLTQEECTVPEPVAQACDRFATETTACLRFKFNKPAVLVVPKKFPLAPNTDVDRQILSYIQALAAQTELAICIPHSFLPLELSHILREEWLGGSWTASLVHAGLDTLYEGSGGLIHADNAALPSYDEVSDGKPPQASRGLGKRRRMSGEGGIGEDETYLERICARLLEKQKADLRDEMNEQSRETRKWVGEQLKNVEKNVETQCRAHLDQRIAEVQQDYQAKFLALGSRLRHLDEACQDKHEESDHQVDDLERHLDDRVWYEVNELRTSIYEDFDELRKEHEEFICDETKSAVDELKLTLSDAEVSLVGGRLEIT